MPRALLAWEFGGDLGHARRAVAIARQLRALGHEMAFAFTELGSLDPADAASIACVPAPRLPFAEPPDPSPLNASHILLNLGYGNAGALAGALAGWKSLIGLLEPDAIVCDYAPTALLAGRAAGLPCLAVGSGFSLPPISDPMPSLRSWTPANPDVLARIDARVMDTVREAWSSVHAASAPPVLAGDLFAAEAQLVCAWPELDPFGPREHVEYLGPQGDVATARQVRWQTEARPRVFAYLKPRDPRFQAILEAIGRMAGEAIVAAPGVSETQERSFLDGRLRVIPAAVDVEAMADADLWVSHGSAGIVAAAMRLGVPQALLPLQLEQYLVARRASENGIARCLDPAATPDLAQYLAAALADATLARAAADARALLAARVPVSVGERIARALER